VLIFKYIFCWTAFQTVCVQL